MNKLITILVFFILIFPQNVCAQPNAANSKYDKTGIYLESGWKSDPDATMIEFGIFEDCDNLSLRWGLSYLKKDNIFLGGHLGARYKIGQRFSPFVGVGLLAGQTLGSYFSADDDGIDNDNDGDVDEDGETMEDNRVVSIYPELGLHFWATDSMRITFSSRYHITTMGRESDFQIYNLGVTFAAY